MSVLRTLAATAGCAVVLGVAVTGLVRAQLSELEAAAASLAAPRPAQTGGDSNPPSRDPEACATTSDNPAAKVASQQEPASKSRPSSPASAAKRSPKSKGSRPAERSSLLGDLGRGIRKVGEGRYEIDRRALDLALGNLALLSRAVRVAPEIRDGKPVGFRLFAVAPDGPFAKLGLRDDDVLVSINHLALATVEQVLEAYGKLKTARHLVLGILRGGHRIALEYAIR